MLQEIKEMIDAFGLGATIVILWLVSQVLLLIVLIKYSNFFKKDKSDDISVLLSNDLKELDSNLKDIKKDIIDHSESYFSHLLERLNSMNTEIVKLKQSIESNHLVQSGQTDKIIDTLTKLSNSIAELKVYVHVLSMFKEKENNSE